VTGDLDVLKWGGYRIVWADSRDPHAAIAYMEAHALDGIGISPVHGFAGDSLGFLAESVRLKGLVVVDNEGIDLAPIEGCSLLEFLTIENVRGELHLDALTNLRDLNLGWNPRLRLPPADGANKLARLQLWGYKADDLNLIPAYECLACVSLVRSTAQTLAGIDRLRGLKQVDLAYCHRLRDVAAVTRLGSLDEFVADHCKKIQDVSVLRKCVSLRILGINNCGSLPSLGFVRDMHSLEELRFVNTTVIDGDLSPCVGLKRVGFMNKRHYSHTWEELNG